MIDQKSAFCSVQVNSPLMRFACSPKSRHTDCQARKFEVLSWTRCYLDHAQTEAALRLLSWQAELHAHSVLIMKRNPNLVQATAHLNAAATNPADEVDPEIFLRMVDMFAFLNR